MRCECVHTKIAHITIHSKFSITTERLEGYKQALLCHDLPYQEEYVKFCKYTNAVELDDAVTRAITSLMQLPLAPDAIFTATDQISTRSVGLINKLGYKIPNDFALIGFTNTDMADILNPSLSTISQPAFEIGEMAANSLISIIEGKLLQKDFSTIRLPTKIQIRDSSTPLILT